MHLKVLRSLKSGRDTIRKVIATLSMPRKKILMINGNGTKMHRFGSVLLLPKEREVPREQGEVFSLLEVWSHWGTMP